MHFYNALEENRCGDQQTLAREGLKPLKPFQLQSFEGPNLKGTN
jgi:hypothetical protein